MKKYKAAYQGGEGEITEKKSRFIATVKPVESEEEALEFVAAMKKKYWNATHNCSAFVVGENMELQRCSDDGEPQGTAGRPMLDVLLGEEIQTWPWWSPGISGERFWEREDWSGPTPKLCRRD